LCILLGRTPGKLKAVPPECIIIALQGEQQNAQHRRWQQDRWVGVGWQVALADASGWYGGIAGVVQTRRLASTRDRKAWAQAQNREWGDQKRLECHQIGIISRHGRCRRQTDENPTRIWAYAGQVNPLLGAGHLLEPNEGPRVVERVQSSKSRRRLQTPVVDRSITRAAMSSVFRASGLVLPLCLSLRCNRLKVRFQ
jgi:hypothetical protein